MDANQRRMGPNSAMVFFHTFRRGQAECEIEGSMFVSLDVDLHECDDGFRVAQETVYACGVHALGRSSMVHGADARIQAAHVNGSLDRVDKGFVGLDCNDIAPNAGSEEREGAVIAMIGSNIKENERDGLIKCFLWYHKCLFPFPSAFEFDVSWLLEYMRKDGLDGN